jgi:hypothetical protein
MWLLFFFLFLDVEWMWKAKLVMCSNWLARAAKFTTEYHTSLSTYYMRCWGLNQGEEARDSSVNLGCFLKYLSQKNEYCQYSVLNSVSWVFKSNCLLWFSMLFCLSLLFFEWRSFVPLSNLFEWIISPSIRIYAPRWKKRDLVRTLNQIDPTLADYHIQVTAYLSKIYA